MKIQHLAFIASVVILSMSAVHGQDSVTTPTLPTEKYQLRASGFFVQNIDTTIRVDGHFNAGGQEWDLGTTIDLAKQLKVETSVEVFRAEAMWNFGTRHRLDFAWFNMEERGRVDLGQAIDFGDTDFAQGLTVESYLRTNIFRLAYTYFLVQKPRVQLGLSLGVHVMDVATGIAVVNTAAAENVGVTAPLPVIGISLNYALTNRLTLRAHGEYFGISYDRYEGELLDFYGAAEWRLNHHWSIGAGVEYFDLDVIASTKRIRVDVEHQWIGYQGYLSYRF